MLDLIPAVSQLLKEASETCVMPVFGKLEANAKEKSPGEWVTVADKASEAFLEPALLALIPGSAIIGEEAASTNSRILDQLQSDGYVWLVDPLDGTANFSQGVPPFALMVTLIEGGETVVSWILEPIKNQLAIAEKGSGAWIDAQRIAVKEDSPDLNVMNGAALRRFLPTALANHLNDVQGLFANLSEGSKCAGFDYPAVANRLMDFVLYWRTLPWDHAAGVLFLKEAGGHAARLDGSEYHVADHSQSGLLVAHNKQTWLKVKATLFP